MTLLKCKICEGNIIPEPGTNYGVCDSCGTATTLPSITDERRTDAFNRGNQFRKDFEFEKALAEYSAIVKEDPTDAEAHWCMALCRYGIYYQQDYSGKYLPTFAQLSDKSFTEDPDYKAALKHANDNSFTRYKQDGQRIEQLRQEMVRVAASTEPYDVFICFKDTFDGSASRTPDSVAAQQIYMFLTQKGYRVFFSRITLKEEHAGQEWEPYIYAALNSSRVMLVVGTSQEHFNSRWVKNEWNRYRALRRQDPTRVLLACYQDMPVKEIPVELQTLEALNIKDSDGGFYTNVEYIVRRECKGQKKATSAASNTKAANLVIRAGQAIEDGEFSRADSMLEQALNLEPHNGTAHLYKLLVQRKCKKITDLADQDQLISDSGSYQRAVKYCDAGVQQQLRALAASQEERILAQKKKKAFSEAKSLLAKADSINSYKKAISALEGVGDYENAEELLQGAIARQNDLIAADERAAEERRIQEEKDEAERQRLAAEKQAKDEAERQAKEKAEKAAAQKAKNKVRNRKIRKIMLLVLLVCGVLYGLNSYMVEPERVRYQEAADAAEAGDYKTAAINYYEVANSPAGELFMKDATDKGYEALQSWLGQEPVVLTTDEAPWFSLDDEDGLVFDIDEYFGDSFVIPTIFDGKLVVGIGDECFYGNSSLTSLSLPDNITWIGQRAFYDCDSLTSVSFGGSMETIGNYAFYDCDSLTAIATPPSTREIWEYAFSECDYLSTVTLNEGLNMIGDNAFAFDKGITALTIAEGVTSIGEYAFEDCDGLTEVNIPGSVTRIGDYAFANCDYLGIVNMASGVQEIGDAAFYYDTALWSVGFPDTLTSIGENAFYSCTSMGGIFLPGTLMSIGPNAFYGCTGMTSLTIADNTDLWIDNEAFGDCTNLATVTLGAGTNHIGDYAFSGCKSLTTVTLNEGLYSIGREAFFYVPITNIQLPSTLNYIGGRAFESSKLEGIEIPASVTTLEEYAFASCESLYWVWFHEGTSVIQDNAFYNTPWLTQVYYSGSYDSWSSVSVGNNTQLWDLELYTDYYG